MAQSERNGVLLAKLLSSQTTALHELAPANQPNAPPETAPQHQLSDVYLTSIPKLSHTPLPISQNDKDKNGKDATMDSCHSGSSSSAHLSEESSSEGDVSEADNPTDQTFSNDEDDEELMPASEKAKWILSEDPIEAMELHFENLGMKDMASFYGIKSMAGLEQHRPLIVLVPCLQSS